MKKLLAFLILTIAANLSVHADVTLFNLGSPVFDIEASQGSFNQTASGIEWNGDMQAADLVGGFLPSSLDLSPYTTPSWQLGVSMTLTGADPDVSFTGEFFDSNFNSAVYSGSTPNIVNGIALLDFESLSDPSFDSTNIIGFQITWGGTGDEPSTLLTATSVMATSTASVPEPGASGMLLLGLGLGALYLSRAKNQRASIS